MSSWLTTYNLPPSINRLKPTAYNLKLPPTTDIKILRFWVLGFQGFATYANFKVLGFQGLATIKILRSWVFRVSLHIKI